MSGFLGQSGPLPGVFCCCLFCLFVFGLTKIYSDLCQDFLGKLDPYLDFVVVVFVVVFSLTKIDIDLCYDFLGKSDPYLEFLCCVFLA